MSENKVLLSNVQFLMEEINWLKQVIQTRIALQHPDEEMGNATRMHPLDAHLPLDPQVSNGVYAQFIIDWQLDKAERLALILALTPELAPQVLDVFFTKNASYNRPFTEFGGWSPQRHKGFLPTWETFYFIVAGNNLAYRIELKKYFQHPHQRLFTNGILDRGVHTEQEPPAALPLLVTKRFLQLAIFEQADFIPTFSQQFPAELYIPKLDWEDLILAKPTFDAVEKIRDWIEYESTILQNEKANKRLQAGYRALFYGSPGTGKSLTAGLIGKTCNRIVFRIDLSKVISKYIGETEKNLANIFDQAENNDWILFFDEADALFGKRVKTNDSKDQYANQQTAYLLQRIEVFPGIAILASNKVDDLDSAFARRFQTIIEFPKPGPYQRLELWKNTFEGFEFDESFNEEDIPPKIWELLAEKYQLTGANIQNILRNSLLLAYKENNGLLKRSFIEAAIEEELEKEKRM